jgi:hypothetical protein
MYPSTFDEVKIVNEMMNDKWIGIEEAAEYLGVKPITVRDWIKKNTGIPINPALQKAVPKLSIGFRMPYIIYDTAIATANAATASTADIRSPYSFSIVKSVI